MELTPRKPWYLFCRKWIIVWTEISFLKLESFWDSIACVFHIYSSTHIWLFHLFLHWNSLPHRWNNLIIMKSNGCFSELFFPDLLYHWPYCPFPPWNFSLTYKVAFSWLFSWIVSFQLSLTLCMPSKCFLGLCFSWVVTYSSFNHYPLNTLCNFPCTSLFLLRVCVSKTQNLCFQIMLWLVLY